SSSPVSSSFSSACCSTCRRAIIATEPSQARVTAPPVEDELAGVIRAVLDRGERERYAGYSKFDALESPLLRILSLAWWPLRLVCTQVVTRAPVDVRPLLGVRRGVNPEAPALFARANLDCLAAGLDGPFVERARQALDWLVANDAKTRGGYPGHGRSWG